MIIILFVFHTEKLPCELPVGWSSFHAKHQIYHRQPWLFEIKKPTKKCEQMKITCLIFVARACHTCNTVKFDGLSKSRNKTVFVK